MPQLKVLICGGGCAGPALAFWLVRAGHDVTIVERHPVLRAAGAQIDLRAQGIEVIKRMGLLEAIRNIIVREPGSKLVDTNNTVWGTFAANTSGKGAQGPTSEYELMRGDLVRLLYEQTKDKVKYVFGKTVESFDDTGDAVTVHFSDGQHDTYDLLVGADGQGSRIRKAILPPGTDPYRHLKVMMGYWMVPRDSTDDRWCYLYFPGDSQWVMRRTHNETETQAYFAIFNATDGMTSIPRAPLEQQKEFWKQQFRGRGWQTDRLLAGLDTTENFYCQEVAQVKIDRWSKGRVVLLADAAHCPTPMTAMGTTSGFTGAYVLAGEINKHSDNLPEAFANYERLMRPFVDEIQKLNMTLIKWVIPTNRWHLWATQWANYLFEKSGLFSLMLRLSPEERGGWQVPDYGDLRNEKSS